MGSGKGTQHVVRMSKVTIIRRKVYQCQIGWISTRLFNTTYSRIHQRQNIPLPLPMDLIPIEAGLLLGTALIFNTSTVPIVNSLPNSMLLRRIITKRASKLLVTIIQTTNDSVHQYIQQMKRLMVGEGLAPSFKRKLQYGAFILGGVFVGYLSAKKEWEQKKPLFENKFTEYQCEDKINTLIQQTRKPAVIYYYLPSFKHHYIMRAHMFKFSNLYPQNAIWVMVNLTQHLHQAKHALKSVIFPDSDIRLEVRFPKENIAIFQSNKKDELELIKEVYSNRREVYNYNVYEQQFQCFLQEHKVIEGEDPVKATLKLTEKALFQ